MTFGCIHFALSKNKKNDVDHGDNGMGEAFILGLRIWGFGVLRTDSKALESLKKSWRLWAPFIYSDVIGWKGYQIQSLANVRKSHY